MATNDLEGLSYLLDPDPAKLGEFVDFCKKGKRNAADSDYEIDRDTGGKMTGVLNWLRGNHIFNANFYLSTSGSLPTLVVTVPPSRITWLDIPGFRQYLRAGALAVTRNTIVRLQPQTDLDEALRRSEFVFNLIAVGMREQLDAALKGDPGTDLAGALRDLSQLSFDIVLV